MGRRCSRTRPHGAHGWADVMGFPEYCPGIPDGPNLPGNLGRRNPPPLPRPGTPPLWRTTWRKAQDAAVKRARETGLKQRVRFCRCGDLVCGLWVVERANSPAQDPMPTTWV